MSALISIGKDHKQMPNHTPKKSIKKTQKEKDIFDLTESYIQKSFNGKELILRRLEHFVIHIIKNMVINSSADGLYNNLQDKQGLLVTINGSVKNLTIKDSYCQIYH